MDKNYDTSLWARDPNGRYHLLASQSQNFSPIRYTFSIGKVTSIPYNSEPSADTDDTTGNNVVINFSLPEAASASRFRSMAERAFI